MPPTGGGEMAELGFDAGRVELDPQLGQAEHSDAPLVLDARRLRRVAPLTPACAVDDISVGLYSQAKRRAEQIELLWADRGPYACPWRGGWHLRLLPDSPHVLFELRVGVNELECQGGLHHVPPSLPLPAFEAGPHLFSIEYALNDRLVDPLADGVGALAGHHVENRPCDRRYLIAVAFGDVARGQRARAVKDQVRMSAERTIDTDPARIDGLGR